MSLTRPAILGAALLLGGCALVSPRPSQSDLAWQARRALLEQIDRFTMKARISAGMLAPTGNLVWQQAGGNYDLRLAGPFGMGAMSISGGDGHVEVQTRKESLTGTDPEQLLNERLGWEFPVMHLRSWVVGLPAKGSKSKVTLDDDGRIETLEQDGWKLSFDDYVSNGRVDLPRKFVLANPDVKIKVVVDEWSDVTAVR
jgi:outer membrane lipoprotein LolB